MTLQELRLKANKTLKTVSEETGITDVHLSRLEHGVCAIDKMSLGHAKALAKALGVTVDTITEAEPVE